MSEVFDLLYWSNRSYFKLFILLFWWSCQVLIRVPTIYNQ